MSHNETLPDKDSLVFGYCGPNESDDTLRKMQAVESIFQSALENKLSFDVVTAVTEDKLFDLVTKLGIKSQGLIIVLEELIINSVEHGNGRPDLYFECESGLLTFIMRDRGVGIHEQIPRNPRLSDTKGKSTSSILRLALEEGITGTGVVGRGMGLYYLSKFVVDHDANCLVASNRGYVVQSRDVFHERSTNKDVDGTIVILQVANREVGL